MLTINDIQALERLYAEAYPGNWFDARMVQTGCYAGVWHGDALVAAAGIHVVSEREDVAGLGNVTSHLTVPRQGFAHQVCARLLRHLDSLGIWHIGLNVAAINLRAQQLYAGLGFVPVAEDHEVMWGSGGGNVYHPYRSTTADALRPGALAHPRLQRVT
jgi:RimJ/RimL family protein N-acetyltransferase